MNKSEAPTTPLSSLEISGAVCARVIHDLSNLVSGIMGNAEYVQNAAPAEPANLRNAIEAITTSANAAGKLLGQCLPLTRILSAEGFPYEAIELAHRIAESVGLAPGWRVVEPGELPGQVRVQPRWFSAAIWQIAREADVQTGEIEFSSGPAVFPVIWRGANPNSVRPVNLFQTTLRYRADEPLLSNDVPINPERFSLIAAYELIRRARGQIHSRPKPPGRQEITIMIPLA